MTKTMLGATLLTCLALGACTNAGTANANGPGQAPSGITASNGGGQRATGAIPNVGVSNGVGVTTTGAPNSKGSAL